MSLSKLYIFSIRGQFTVLIVWLLSGCSWEDRFLDAKPDQSLIVPTTLGDYDRLLNNNDVFNLFKDPALGMVSSDEYTVTSETFNNLSRNMDRNAYIWASDIYEGETVAESEWRYPYEQVYYANTILEGIEKISVQPSEQENFNRIKGSALFLRSRAFYNLVQVYALPYDPETSASDLGIPLRLSSDLNIKISRNTVQECYDRIFEDLEEALQLLPARSQYKTLPSALATLGLLSRISLAIRKYDDALEYANRYLDEESELTDYNTVTPTSFSLHTTFMDEDVFQSSMTSIYSVASRTRAVVPQDVIDSYHENDLRKTLLFNVNAVGEHFFKGYYNHNGYLYNGIATDEIYLIRAECYARNGEVELALNDLNYLLSNRWKSDAEFQPYLAANSDEALDLVLLERRKELLFRGLRWTDLRRLNKEDRFKVTLSRTVNGQTYTLPPNDPRYALPIPDSEIQLSGLPQNPR